MMRTLFPPRFPLMPPARKTGHPPDRPEPMEVQPALSKPARFAGDPTQTGTSGKNTPASPDMGGTHPDFVGLFLEGGNRSAGRSEGGTAEEPGYSGNPTETPKVAHDSRRWVREALSRAAAAGSSHSVNKLLQRAAALHSPDEKGETTLMQALRKGNPDLATQLPKPASAFVLPKDRDKPMKSRLGMQSDAASSSS